MSEGDTCYVGCYALTNVRASANNERHWKDKGFHGHGESGIG